MVLRRKTKQFLRRGYWVYVNTQSKYLINDGSRKCWLPMMGRKRRSAPDQLSKSGVPEHPAFWLELAHDSLLKLCQRMFRSYITAWAKMCRDHVWWSSHWNTSALLPIQIYNCLSRQVDSLCPAMAVLLFTILVSTAVSPYFRGKKQMTSTSERFSCLSRTWSRIARMYVILKDEEQVIRSRNYLPTTITMMMFGYRLWWAGVLTYPTTIIAAMTPSAWGPRSVDVCQHPSSRRLWMYTILEKGTPWANSASDMNYVRRRIGDSGIDIGVKCMTSTRNYENWTWHKSIATKTRS